MARRVVLALLVLSYFVACSHSFIDFTKRNSLPPTPSPPCPSPKTHCPRTWSYANAGAWGSLCKDWATCSAVDQSPVDLPTVVNPRGCMDAPFQARYTNTSTCLFNTGNFFVFPVNKTNANVFKYNGINYALRRVEFHSPSEHLLNGKRYDLEVNFYHDSSAQSGRTLVTSVFYNRPNNENVSAPATNPFLEQFVHQLPEFSDCNCGDGRTQFLSGPEFYGVNEQCDDGIRNSNNSPPFSCCRANCVKPVCGDGILDAGEICDNGTRNSNSTPGACRTNCCLPYCGDGVVDPSEQCDDGNTVNGDGCTSICRSECGNGVLNPSLEQCDNGTANSNTAPNACRLNCRLSFCGDGVVDSNEQCDNGTWTGINPAQCRRNCTVPVCGDGITDPNEDCDNGASNGPNSTCSTTCRTNCGDGIVQKGEYCDDGPLNSNLPDAACRTNCFPARCGDGIVDASKGEQCDSVEVVNPSDPNSPVYGNRYCSRNCTQVCGACSGPTDLSLECNHGCNNADIPNKCRTNCMNPICGDGIVDVTEECDTGNYRSNSKPDACRMNCSLPTCGDAVVDSGEQCDRGSNNGLRGSGCSEKCQLLCGNGILDFGEQCDAGAQNGNASDTCRADCSLPRCGDGVVDSGEECDDGRRNNNTSPNMCRSDCSLPYCGDGIIDFNYGEKCDFGKDNSDVDPDGCSLFCVPNYCRQRCLNDSVDLSLSLPHNQSAYTYMGSVPYPPCSTDVEWIVFNNVQELSNFQYNQFAASPYGLNGTRPVQPLGSRQVKRPCVYGPPQCGNGIQESGEECDLGRLLNSDWQANRCRSNCSLPYCGDGVTDRGEECDDGVLSTPRCTSLCRLVPVLTNPFATKPWDYKNPCKWSFLNPEWNLCAADRPAAEQSPINLVKSVYARKGPGLFYLPINYNSTTYTSYFTGRALSLIALNPEKNILQDEGKTYYLKRVEFHTPSEHTINGYHADLEADIIHEANDGTFAIVAVLFNRTGNGTKSSRWISDFEFCLPTDFDCRFNNMRVEPSLGEVCDDGPLDSNLTPGRCRRNGQLPFTGDGVVDRFEQCDRGKANAYKPNTCRPNGFLPCCGDGIVDMGEECDFNAPNGPACTRQCQLLCGNGLLDPNESCDNGHEHNSDMMPNTCRTNCRLPGCGDGVVDSGEQCDDGPANSNITSGACRTNCRLPRCGDGVIDYGYDEECDNGNANGPLGSCLSNCTLSCGTGVLLPGTVKQCDNGANNSNTDGHCRTDCSRPRCGDGILDRSMGEECDPGGPLPTVYCSSRCTILCGNGKIDFPPNTTMLESCDEGANNDDTKPNGCRTNCQLYFCGDGVKDAGEECDFGALNANTPGAPCRTTCVLPRCGDNICDPDETCDDGNRENGDGCSGLCQNECGNGVIDGYEECDEGCKNSDLPDSCRPAGFNGMGGCKNPSCGDGVVDSDEQCDDGAMNSDFLPNRCRTNCRLPYCGDGVTDDYYGEKCDRGDNNDDYSGLCSETCILNSCRKSDPPAGRVLHFSYLFDLASPVISYYGSLLTPPCTEGVKWFVMEKPNAISELQYEKFSSRLRPNNVRGLQPHNGRDQWYTLTRGPVCGNCMVEEGEECDKGEENGLSPDACRPNCKIPRCGDGVTDTGEQCDDGAKNSLTGPCGPNCNYVKGCPAKCEKNPCEQNTSVIGGNVINVNFADLLAQ